MPTTPDAPTAENEPPKQIDDALPDAVFDDVPDDQPLEWDEAVADDAVVDLEGIDDDGPSDIDLPELEEPNAAAAVGDDDPSLFKDDEDEPIDPVTVGCTEAGTVNGAQVPIHMDPASAKSKHVGGAGGEATVVMKGLTLRVTLEAAPGAPECVYLGRDALAGRVVIAV